MLEVVEVSGEMWTMMIPYLQLNIPVDLPAVVVERDQLEPGDVDVVLQDSVRHPHGQVKDGVLVRLDGFRCVDDKDEGRVEDLVAVPALTVGLAARLGTVLTFTADTPGERSVLVLSLSQPLHWEILSVISVMSAPD